MGPTRQLSSQRKSSIRRQWRWTLPTSTFIGSIAIETALNASIMTVKIVGHCGKRHRIYRTWNRYSLSLYSLTLFTSRIEMAFEVWINAIPIRCKQLRVTIRLLNCVYSIAKRNHRLATHARMAVVAITCASLCIDRTMCHTHNACARLDIA